MTESQLSQGPDQKNLQSGRMARSVVKARFQPKPPEFSKEVNLANMTKIWH